MKTKRFNDSTKPSTGDTKTTVTGNTATPTATLTGSPQSGTGAVTASLPKAAADNLIAEAKKAEAAGQNAVIQIKVETAGQSNAVNVNIPKESFNGIATGTKAEVKIETALGTVKFDTDAVKGINSAATSGDLSISIARVETESLADTVRQLVGDRPVYDFTVSAAAAPSRPSAEAARRSASRILWPPVRTRTRLLSIISTIRAACRPCAASITPPPERWNL